MSQALSDRCAQAIVERLGAPVSPLVEIARGIGAALEARGTLAPSELEGLAREAVPGLEDPKEVLTQSMLAMEMLKSCGVVDLVFRDREGYVMSKPEVGAALRKLLLEGTDDGVTALLEACQDSPPRRLGARP